MVENGDKDRSYSRDEDDERDMLKRLAFGGPDDMRELGADVLEIGNK